MCTLQQLLQQQRCHTIQRMVCIISDAFIDSFDTCTSLQRVLRACVRVCVCRGCLCGAICAGERAGWIVGGHYALAKTAGQTPHMKWVEASFSQPTCVSVCVYRAAAIAFAVITTGYYHLLSRVWIFNKSFWLSIHPVKWAHRLSALIWLNHYVCVCVRVDALTVGLCIYLRACQHANAECAMRTMVWELYIRQSTRTLNRPISGATNSTP